MSKRQDRWEYTEYGQVQPAPEPPTGRERLRRAARETVRRLKRWARLPGRLMEAAQTAWALRAWPLVWRSHYAADIAALWQFIDADNKRRTEAAQFAEAVRADEDKKRAKALDEVLPRLFRITGYAVDNYRTYAVTVTFHREMVEMAFVHGNSQEQIRWLAMDLSRRIEHELLTLNFARFRDPREREPSLANPFDPRAYYRPNDPIDPLAAGGPVTGGRR